MTARWTPFEILTGTGAAFLCLVFACVFLEASRIEAGLAARAVAALDGAALYWFAVEPSGRRLTLTGAAADAASVEAAGGRVAQVSGASAIDNRISAIGAAGACQQQLDHARGAQPVAFRKGQEEIAPSSDAVLAALAQVLKRCGVRVEVAVHAEAGGSAAMSLVLSQRRAEQVARRLVSQGVDVDRVVASGYGVTQPVTRAPTGPSDPVGEAGRSIDQRVEFRVLGAAT